MLLEVDKDSTVGAALANGEIIYSEHSWSVRDIGRVRRTPNKTQQCGGADFHEQALHETTTCFTSQGETYQPQNVA
jgi:hypothetical protein